MINNRTTTHLQSNSVSFGFVIITIIGNGFTVVFAVIRNVSRYGKISLHC